MELPFARAIHIADPWDIISIEKRGSRHFEENLVRDADLYLNNYRHLRFWPLTCRYTGRLTPVEKRYKQAEDRGDIDPNEVSLEDFRAPAMRLIGGEPLTDRRVMLVDHWISTCETVLRVSESLIALGYPAEHLFVY